MILILIALFVVGLLTGYFVCAFNYTKHLRLLIDMHSNQIKRISESASLAEVKDLVKT